MPMELNWLPALTGSFFIADTVRNIFSFVESTCLLLWECVCAVGMSTRSNPRVCLALRNQQRVSRRFTFNAKLVEDMKQKTKPTDRKSLAIGPNLDCIVFLYHVGNIFKCSSISNTFYAASFELKCSIQFLLAYRRRAWVRSLDHSRG